MTITQDDIKAVNQRTHDVMYKLEVLNEYLFVESEITASASNITFNIDAESDMRRTGTLTMLVEDKAWVEETFEIGWMNKFIRFNIGLLYNDAYRWYRLGTMVATSDAFNYDATTKELQLTLADIMGILNSERGSQIGTPVQIRMDSVIKDALEATISRYSILKRTEIADFPDVIPYDLDFAEGAYPYEIMKKILDLFPWYEQYFDVEGVYHANQIPMRKDEACLLNAEDIDDLIISEKRSINFSDIKNTTEIWGKQLKSDYSATQCTLNGSTYTLGFLVQLQTVEANKKYSFTPNADSPASPSFTFPLVNDGVTSTETLPMLDSTGAELEAGALSAGRTYVARCIMTTVDDQPVKKLYLMGQKDIHVIVREMNIQPTVDVIRYDKSRNACEDILYVINPDSPYACDRTNGVDRYLIQDGEIRQVLKDGDYASIYSTSLAYQRGEYENYLRCRMNTDVELTTILIPFIDVNQKIEYTSPTTKEKHQYIVKSVNMDVSGFKMTMKLARFYNYYPFYE